MARQYDMDRRAYLTTIGAAGATALLAGCTQEGSSGSDAETLVPGTAPGFAPFEFKEGGELTGFDIDLLAAVAEEAGYELAEWSELDFETLIPSLTEGDIDIIAAGMTITDERSQQIAFSDPYFESNQSVLVREGGSFQPESEDDLSGNRVGAQSGTTGEGEVERMIEEGTLSGENFRQFENYPLAVDALESGDVDAVVADVPVAENFAASRDVEIAFTIQTNENFGFGMRQDDDRIEDINEGLSAVQESGTYDELVSEYFG
ncbi:transporter substrate-binding domain-containing protein [Halovenus sp. WSH3]|uniref:Transporter substrate-binding domain-containing protein n=1 Tax=Halovenus carboxidivorans TaxID=2692199 RepID=A0A6B0SXU2_9EURY|nr:transporter substrate-binding domain-containing protein [Halovenus carboxidivorans]MXR50165.1 transporter substrate-binding domain-containing protein [Halovenus carboxidivorans]